MAEYDKLFQQPRLNEDTTKGRFDGQVCIVTGGASGIGGATVDRLLNDGAKVTVFDVNAHNMQLKDERLKETGFVADFYNVDVSDKNQCVATVAKVAEKHGGLVHILVNCAVYFGSKALEATKDDWEKSMGVNVQGYSNMVQACHPYMVKAGGKGCAILNVSSISAHRAQKWRWTYASTKGAISILTKCMALDLSKDGIRVNSVSPGWIWSPVGAKAAEFDRQKYEPSCGVFAMLKRFGEMSEVAATICFLCSRDASFITGSDIPVDGGYQGFGPERHGEEFNFAAKND